MQAAEDACMCTPGESSKIWGLNLREGGGGSL